MGYWSETEMLGKQWSANCLKEDGSEFQVLRNGTMCGSVRWGQTGSHNVNNALAAIAAARHVGVLPEAACDALCHFQGVKRRMELVADVHGVKIYDDFAHHPTAIATTLEGFRARVGESPVRVIIEPRSNTMKMGIHKQALADATQSASEVIWFKPDVCSGLLRRS